MSPLIVLVRRHWVMGLATAAPDGIPYPAPVFYAVAVEMPTPTLVFISDPDSEHGRHIGRGPTPVAASIYGQTNDVDAIEGVQLRGDVVRIDRLARGTADRLAAAYLARHPGAAPPMAGNRPEHFYGLAITWAKITENRRLGLGHHETVTHVSPWRAVGTIAAGPSNGPGAP